MPHPFFRRAGALALLGALLTPQAGALSDISVWAQEGVTAAQEAGLMPSSLEARSAKGEITRAEFCGIAVNAYKAVSGKAVFASGKKPFRDCDDPSVVAAYELGLVNGRGDGVFDPDASIERQDLCVMLYNILDAAGIDAPAIAGDACVEDYPDVPEIKDYAVNAMITMVDYTVVNGIAGNDQTTILAPDGTATREQAVIMASRFCSAFAEESDNTSDNTTDSWDDPDPDMTLPQTDEEKWALVYGASTEKYQTAEEAEANIVEVAVPVWRLQSDGTKTAGTAYIEVNRSLAPIVEDIFEEIFNGDEQFPIKNVGGYSWRTGEHSQGTAIDINWEENMEATINADGSLTPTTGSYWLPGEDPYSIPEGGDVYNAFISHGFLWGGNAWRSKRDYMHFSYFGT
ncbi:M15 family metallopeptidase [Agathobaculum sp. Marseille-P7918]|uniref:M15 family metallopeptidase n=1 Tax=Agathobaculum sp. Marseille-P7918 TaxID=2479843 RepID=UPI0013DDC3AA|nr:M15 family metallopeptidase [Agathobaculum sp. Marseille-P7918]